MITKNTPYTVNQSRLEVITCSWRKARENACERVKVGSGFTSDWMKKWREFFEPTCGIVSAKPITFRHSNENRSNRSKYEIEDEWLTSTVFCVRTYTKHGPDGPGPWTTPWTTPKSPLLIWKFTRDQGIKNTDYYILLMSLRVCLVIAGCFWIVPP